MSERDKDRGRNRSRNTDGKDNRDSRKGSGRDSGSKYSRGENKYSGKGSAKGSSRPAGRKYDKDSEGRSEKATDRRFSKSSGGEERKDSRKKYSSKSGSSYDRNSDKKYDKPSGRKSYKDSSSKYSKDSDSKYERGSDKKFGKSSSRDSNKKYGSASGRSYERDSDKKYDKAAGRKPYKDSSRRYTKDSESDFDKDSERKFSRDAGRKFEKGSGRKYSKDSRKETEKPKFKDRLHVEDVRLNRFISNAGVCSRRDADELIKQGKIKVNGEVVTEMGLRVKHTDRIEYKGEHLKPETFQYVLLNKPKDFITTMDDPDNRKTVMNLVHKACDERIYPVGRLDRHTTGLLLFTNDGELAKKLTHPSFKIKKIYQVEIDRPIEKEDFEAILDGVELDDGVAVVDELAQVGPGGQVLGIEIHIGKNRIVRRIFEHFGYKVVKLDRVMFGPLTKKDLSRGKYRLLSPKEIQHLKNSVKKS